ncbi:potassium channel family protein [Virgibacillus ndiopensis]|uniref:potassium channel family protein n=1 Tax=Virgibacillus ndiopensis TaxID=2004408 RepID=UPI000C0721F2|nr:potassium channel family protein [Virgibacillus ndiopensis]
MSIELFKHIYFRLPVVVRLLLTIFITMVLFGIVIHFIEPTEFPSIFDGIWWAFVTGATVGYGDYVPLSIPGRVVGILLILSGGGLLTFYITTISAATIKHEQDLSKGKVAFKGTNHVIFIGWNERTRHLLNMTLKQNNKVEIVLIDRTLSHLPYQQFPVHFIHGDPSEDTTLERARIDLAESVIITADITKKERQADVNTILTTVAIRGNNKNVRIIAEILSTAQVDNAIRAGADTTIGSNDFMSTLFYHELFNPKTTKPVETILELLLTQHFSHTRLPGEFENKPFMDIIHFFLKKNHLPFGIIREEEWNIKPSHNFIMKKGDIILTFSSWK